MRVIAGRLKGQRLEAVAANSTRPTTDRVKEAWVSSVTSLLGADLPAANVLDAFAGSGALGIELLSRGAASCVFLENNKSALQVLNANVKALALEPKQARVVKVDSFSAQLVKLLADANQFDVIVLDPPYSCPIDRVKKLLCLLASAGLISKNALISYEHSKDRPVDLDNNELCRIPTPMAIDLVSRKTYGTIGIDYFRCLL